MSYSDRPAIKLAIVWHEKTVPAEAQETPIMDSDEEHTDPYSDDSDEGYGYGYGNAYGRRARVMQSSSARRREVPAKAVRFGLPQVVVFDPSWQKGGPKADEGLRKVGGWWFRA